MAFLAIADQNPFIISTILLGLLLLVRSLSLHYPGRLRLLFLKAGHPFHHVLILVFLTSLAFIPIFESYFTVYECSVSTRYMNEVLDCAKLTMTTLTSLSVPYWLDYATLLAALRYQSINPWDHDADLSILHPDHPLTNPVPWSEVDHPPSPLSGPTPPPNVAALLSSITAAGLHTKWDPSRHLIQTRLTPTSSPHIDIWLWTPSIDPVTSQLHLWTADHTVHYNPRPLVEVWPLVNVTWLGRQVTIPRESDKVSSREFGVYGGSYLISAVFRGDCLHNFFNLRWMY